MEIDHSTIIILLFDKKDQYPTTYGDLIEFDYMRALISKEINRSAKKLNDSPPIYLYELQYGSNVGFTSEIFKILYDSSKKHSVNIQEHNLEAVIQYAMQFDVTLCPDYDSQKLLLNYVKTSQDSRKVLYVCQKNISTFSEDWFNNVSKLCDPIDVNNLCNKFNVFVHSKLPHKHIDFSKVKNHSEFKTQDNIKLLIIDIKKYGSLNNGSSIQTKDIYSYTLTLNKILMNKCITMTMRIENVNSISSVHVFEVNANKILKEYFIEFSQTIPQTAQGAGEIDKIFMPSEECSHLIFLATPR